MTLIAERPDIQSAQLSPEAEPPVRIVHVRAVVMSVAVVALVLVLSVLLVEGPVSHSWYEARQHARATGWTQKRAHTKVGQTLAILQIPSIGLNLPVVEGDSPALLRGGPGHAPGSAIPGHAGNSVIFGHNKGWGAPFSKLSQIEPGAMIYVKVHGATEALAYNVTGIANTKGDTSARAESKDQRLTLITGRGGRLSDGYVVITAVSGSPGPSPGGRPIVSNPSSGSPSGRDSVLLLLRIAVLVAIVALLRRRYSPSVVVTISILPALLALLTLALYVDQFLPVLG